jgi:hypothetical protein
MHDAKIRNFLLHPKSELERSSAAYNVKPIALSEWPLGLPYSIGHLSIGRNPVNYMNGLGCK